MSATTEKRKDEHIRIVLQKNVQYSFGPGFDNFNFIHNALPEMSLRHADLSCKFLGTKLSAPLMISAMTGGYQQAERINKSLAKTAQKYGIAFALGSQRAMLENPSLVRTYDVRKEAPSVPVISNIGAVQLKKYGLEKIESLVSLVESDALAIHLNPLQEVIQAEGDHDFSEVLGSIEKVCESISVPVIVKETGAGMSKKVAEKLKAAGVSMIDVAGAGGTSWSRVEYERGGAIPGFEDWGITTVDSILMCRGILPLIASGGIRSGIDAAKAIALGAEMTGAAYPFLKAHEEGRLDEEIELWIAQMKLVAFLTGSRTYEELKEAELL